MKYSLPFVLLVFLFACGGGSSSAPGVGVKSQEVKLNMTLASALVNQGTQFSANIPVNWSVKEKNGGSITNNGLYTAPTNVGVFHVVATSVADSSSTVTT